MAQANTENSTTSPAVSTRRRFLSQATGVAAGGTVLAMATVSAPAGAAPPLAAVAASGVDPIFSLIEDYRVAAKVVEAAAIEVDRREGRLIDEGLGEYPVICVLDATCVRGKAHHTMIYTHDQIDRHLPPDRFSKANAEARASLDAKIAQHNEVMGDSEKVLYAAQDMETQAVDILVWTAPTTIAGCLALLEMRWDLRRILDDDQDRAVTESIAEVLRDVHPNVAAIDTEAAKS